MKIAHDADCKVCAQLHQSDSNLPALFKYIPGVLLKKITPDQLREKLNACLLYTSQLTDSGDGVDGSSAAASDDAFLNSSLGCVQSILDAELLVLHLDLSSSADLDDSHAASQLCQTLLQLSLIHI